MSKNVILVCAFLLLCGVACAAEAVSPVAAVTAVTAPLWKTILMGAIGGAMAAIYGWLKNRDKTGQEAFGWQYAACTVVVGALLGAVAGWKGLPDTQSAIDWVQNSSVGALVIPGVEMLLKLIFRQAPPTLSSILNVLKGTAPTPPTK